MIKFSQKKVGWLLLFILIALLWLAQWQALFNPYFWDEMGVYAYGANYLFEHGISLFPKALPPEISRGHPLLIFGLYASFLKIFGNSLFAAHSLALFISSLTLVACYRLARYFTPPIIAILAVALLACQNIFLAQSTLVLPEMLVALLTVLAFNSYFRKKYLWSILFLCVGVLVKESMIMTAGFIGLVYLIEAAISKNFKQSLLTLFGFSAPLIVLGIFLLIQKAQNGWYFFPYHTDLISDGVLAGFKTKFKDHFKFIFYAQGRFLWFPLLFLGAITAGVFSKRRKELIILLAFVGSNIFLFAMAFYMDRYLLYLYPLICVLQVSAAYFLLKNKFLVWSVLGILCFFPFVHSNIITPGFNYDADLRYHNIIRVHKEGVSDLCAAKDFCPPNKSLKVYANFPINMSLWESYFGYADEACLAELTLVNTPESANYILFFYGLGDDDIELNTEDYISSKHYGNRTGSLVVYQNIIPLEEWAQFDNSLFLEENNKD